LNLLQVEGARLEKWLAYVQFPAVAAQSSHVQQECNQVQFIRRRFAGQNRGWPDFRRHAEIRHPDFTGIDGGHPRPPCDRA